MLCKKFSAQWPILLSAVIVPSQDACASTWWYEQAERLQLVSAALLDGAPISEPVPLVPFVETRMLMSLLPKPNPKVGSKAEKVPAAPFHAVPTLVGGLPLRKDGRGTFVGTAWAGYLPLAKSMAKIVGINASLNHYILGMSGEFYFRLPSISTVSSIGGQFGNALLDGSITAVGANDSFKAKMLMFYFAQGVQFRKMPLWANGMLLFRKGNSEFNIGAEKTTFVREDTLSDAPVPLAVQATVGYSIWEKKLHFALSEYMVPNRLAMPRVSVMYQHHLGKSSGPVRRDSLQQAPESPRSRRNNRSPRRNPPRS